MAASSPYTGNDYNAVSNYRPYELPINDIFKAISAQDEFWKIGARRVKSLHDNALSLDLTLDANKEAKKKYIEEADKKLTKLSSMDLSDPSVQRQGFDIYKPLFNDEAIMYDNQLTKTLKGIYGEAERYKKTKLSSTGIEGEGYTDRNLAYSLDGFENFRADLPRDPEILKELYSKLGKRKFTPYYNPTKEYTSILKNCKGSSTEKQDVASNYMYFDSYSKNGANSSETSNCFMMGLSENAKQQMGIDGWAYYKANPELLIADHQMFAYGRHEQQLKAIQGKIDGIKAGGITDAEKLQLQELEDMIPTLQQEVDNRKKEYNEMVGGNAMRYIDSNFKTLAKGIYLNKNYAALGEAFKSDENSRKLTANAAGIAQFNAIERAASQKREHDYNMEEIMLRGSLSRKLKQEAGEIPLDMVGVITPVATEDNDTKQSYKEQDFQNEKKQAFKSYSDAYQTLTSYILSKNPNLDKKLFTDAYVLNWANEHSKKPAELQDRQFNELMATYNATKDNYVNMDMRQKAIESIVKNKMTTEQKDNLSKSWSLSDGTVVKSDYVPFIRRESKEKWVAYGDTGGGGGNMVTTDISYEINGKIYKEGTEDFKKIRSVIDNYNKVASKYQSEKDELYRNQYYSTNSYSTPRLDPAKNVAIDTRIKNTIGVTGDANKKDGYKLFGHDVTGKDLYIIPLDEDGQEINLSTDSKMFTTMYKRNPNVSLKSIGGKNVVVIPNVLPALPDVPTERQQNDISNLRNFQTLMETQLSTKGAYYSSEDLKNPDNTMFPYSNFSFKTERGTNVKVKAVKMNGQVKLVPSIQRVDGSWDDNYQTFSKPEDLVLYFRIY